MWNNIKKQSGSTRTCPIQPSLIQDKVFHNPEEISEILADTYYDISANANYDKTFLTQKIKAENSLINFDPLPQPNAESLYYNLPFSEN